MIKENEPKTKLIQTVLWRVLALNLFVAALKIAVGLSTGIISIVADGFHSLLDGSSNVVALAGVRVAQNPPDEDHPYGHTKAETLATLFIGFLLFFAAYEILKSALDRLFSGTTPGVTAASLAVMGLTIVINLLVTIYEHRKGKALKSEILLADAQHTRTDIWISLSVVAGLVGVQLGWPWLDAGVGLAIAAIIGYSALKILFQAGNILMDKAVLPSDEIEQMVLQMPEVLSVERIRSRGQSDATYVDLHIRVRPDTPTDYAHSIAHAVQGKIKAAFPQALDVTIHIEPETIAHLPHPNISRQLKAIAHSVGGSAHEIWSRAVDERYFVELHLELPPNLSLERAHELATEMENRGRIAIPAIAEITTHLEPMGETLRLEPTQTHLSASAVMAQAQHIADAICGPKSSHHLQVWPEGESLALSMHCKTAPTLSLTEAHSLSQQVESALRREIPHLKRVVVHMEPHSQALSETRGA